GSLRWSRQRSLCLSARRSDLPLLLPVCGPRPRNNSARYTKRPLSEEWKANYGLLSPESVSFNPEPGLIFGASTWLVGGNRVAFEKNGSACEVLAVGEDISD